MSRIWNTFFFLLFIDAPSDAAIGRVGTGSLLFDNLSQNGFLGCPTLPVDFHLRSGDSFPFYKISILLSKSIEFQSIFQYVLATFMQRDRWFLNQENVKFMIIWATTIGIKMTFLDMYNIERNFYDKVFVFLFTHFIRLMVNSFWIQSFWKFLWHSTYALKNFKE